MAAGKKTGKKSQASNDFLFPSPVTSLTVTDVGSSRPYLETAVPGSAASVNGTGGAFTVSWTSSGPNAATSFDVSTTPFLYTVNVNSSPYTFQGLASNTQYTVSVVARNSDGTSSPTTSLPVLATTVPAQISTPTATAGVNQNSIAFSTPANGGKAISVYTVNGSDGTSNTGSSSPITVADQAGTSQNYTVKATNENGDSIVSPPSNNVTTQSPSFFAPPVFFSPPVFFAPPQFFSPPNFGGQPCIYSDTKIKTVSGYKMAKDIQVGEILLTSLFNEMPKEGLYSLDSWNSDQLGNPLEIESTVTSIKITEVEETIIFNNNQEARFSLYEDILIFKDGLYKFMRSSEIEVGDSLVSIINNKLIKTTVNSIEIIKKDAEVYHFFMSPYGLILADKIVVHQ